ncbi:hypothetical protein MIMGU_mgv1a015145mg [Erythranthe guttata]|uniref:Uncharacterized protein n=1 Tax=Erythranthe guttata TaxID=4155 RepID=A0A022PXL2_ERYGU|nr:hypothetical protein MIMGU_mgv1a015145mg [Erythranthe guttata]
MATPAHRLIQDQNLNILYNALRDLTNSVKPPPKLAPSVGRKLNAVAEEKFPGSVVEERFLHNHRECVAAQAKAVDMDYFLMSVGLSNDIPVKLSGRKALQLSSKKAESKMKHLEMEEISAEHLCGDEVVRFKKSELSPACRSPKSPRAPYTNWEDDELSELMVIQTP